MKRFGCMIVLLLLVVIIGSSVFLVSRTLDDTPLVSDRKILGVDDAARIMALGKKARRTLFYPRFYPSLTISQHELDALSAFLARSVSRVACELKIRSAGLEGAFTFRLPDNPFGKFLNVRFSVSSSSQGIKFAGVFVGEWPLPEPLSNFLAKRVADFWLGDQLGSLALQSIQSLAITEHGMTVAVSGESLAEVYRSLNGSGKIFTPVADPEAVRFYYGNLAKIEADVPGGNLVSLSTFMGPLFQIAEMRSQTKDPVAENRAAILAMAMYFGSRQFETVIGPILTENLKVPRRRNYKVVLAKRRDLRLHFIISAGLEIISDPGMSFSVGEFKELLDASHGGSGFSFIDLAADIAGIRFAEAATNSPESARYLQQILAKGEGESLFFPEIADLPEGLEQGRFEARYKDVQSSEYQRLVAEIDRRIEKLPLFKTPTH